MLGPIGKLRDQLTTRLNAHAGDIHELTCRIVVLEGQGKKAEGDKSYTDTLNRLFPWGCETESEVIVKLVRRVIALEDDMEKLKGAVISDAVRLNAYA